MTCFWVIFPNSFSSGHNSSLSLLNSEYRSKHSLLAMIWPVQGPCFSSYSVNGACGGAQHFLRNEPLGGALIPEWRGALRTTASGPLGLWDFISSWQMPLSHIQLIAKAEKMFWMLVLSSREIIITSSYMSCKNIGQLDLNAHIQVTAISALAWSQWTTSLGNCLWTSEGSKLHYCADCAFPSCPEAKSMIFATAFLTSALSYCLC